MLFVLILGLIIFSSCNKDNDTDLRAKWQLREVRVKNEVRQKYDSVFYNFDNYVFCFLKLVPNSFESFQTYGEFAQKGDSLIINMKDDYYATPDILNIMEWHDRVMRFQIRKLDNRSLELSDRDTLYVFRKF
ncbi:MAG: lipocalin-like domain-containing protein [Bacteroidales bacterium]